jgi:hypothetical protein
MTFQDYSTSGTVASRKISFAKLGELEKGTTF